MITEDSCARRSSPRQLVAELAQAVPALPPDAPLSLIAELCLSDDEHDWLVLVDADDRVVRLVERAAFLRGEPFEHGVVVLPATTSIAASVHYAMARPRGQRLWPVVCERPDRGCGLVRIERLLEALVAEAIVDAVAAEPPAQALRRPASEPARAASSPSVNPGS